MMTKRPLMRVRGVPARRPGRREIWQHYSDYSVADVRAVQAVFAFAQSAVRPPPDGEPWPELTPSDAKRFLDLVIEGLSDTYNNGAMAGFASGDFSGAVSFFIDGRRSVGQQLVKLSRLKVSLLEQREKQ